MFFYHFKLDFQQLAMLFAVDTAVLRISMLIERPCFDNQQLGQSITGLRNLVFFYIP